MPPVLSKLWSHFDLIVDQSQQGKRGDKRQCRYCKHVMSATQLARAKKHLLLCKHVPGDVKSSLDSTTSSYNFTTSSNQFSTPTSSQNSSTSSIQRYLHHVTPTEKSKIDLMCAQMIFELNLPFKVVESDVFRDYSATLNSAYRPPSAKTLSTTLLDRVYNERNKELEAFLAGAENLTIVSDGWSNIRRDHIVNYVIVRQKPNFTSTSYFYRSTCTNGTQQTAKNVFLDLKKVIEEIGDKKICAVVTDNCSVMQKVWELIEKYFPHISANGCAPHVLNLLIKDIFSIRDNMYTLSVAKDISKFVRNHNIVLDRFRKIQSAHRSSGLIEKITALTLPCDTRWYASHSCIRALLINKSCILSLFQDRDFNSELRDRGVVSIEKIIGYVNDFQLWNKFEALDSMLSPISKAIGELESDQTDLSWVYLSFLKLRKMTSIKSFVNSRWNFLHTESMGIAYLLNPFSEGGKGFIGNDRFDAYNALINRFTQTFLHDSTDLEEEEKAINGFKAEVNAYLSEISPINKSSNLKIVAKGMDPLGFWINWGTDYKRLRTIAITIFSICTSSASSERVWSLFDFIHSKRRNRLSNEKVEKLVFIYANSTALKSSITTMMEEENESDDSVSDSEMEVSISDEESDVLLSDEESGDSVISSSCAI